MRVMGLDFGAKTVGVAISDPLGLTAQGVETITRTQENKLRKTLARIETLAGKFEVEKIVLGFPKHMNNDVGERAKRRSLLKRCWREGRALKWICGTRDLRQCLPREC